MWTFFAFFKTGFLFHLFPISILSLALAYATLLQFKNCSLFKIYLFVVRKCYFIMNLDSSQSFCRMHLLTSIFSTFYRLLI